MRYINLHLHLHLPDMRLDDALVFFQGHMQFQGRYSKLQQSVTLTPNTDHIPNPEISLTIFFEFNTDRRTRGHQFKLKKRQLAKDIRLHFFSERVINRWNGLPSDVVYAKSLNLFKAGLQQMRDTQVDFFMDEQSHKSSGHSSSDREWPHQVNYQVNYNSAPESDKLASFYIA